MFGRALKRNLAALAATALLPALALVASTPTATSAADRTGSRTAPVVSTGSGLVRGVTADRADRFLGLPYAAPPVRDLRFAPPATPASWKGVRAADEQSPACLQFQPSGVREEQAVSEDCLYLDVYRPSGTRPGARLPVLVWFHGGANTQGTGVIYGGGSLAATTDVIVVTVNYRLGALGFLAHPALSEETPGGSGNYARMDQVASLQWVQDNIARFGGDTGNVTIAGQSAGGGAVCDLMAMPSARGLFDKAAVQSSQCLGSQATLAAGEQSGVTYAAAVGCTDAATVVSCLRKAWPGTLIAHQGDYLGGSKVGGPVLPKSFRQAFADGSWNAVPVLTGNTRSENRLASESLVGLTADGYQELVRTTYGVRAEDVLRLYPLREFANPWDAITQIRTDAQRACTNQQAARLLSTKTPVYRYEFNDPTSPTLYGFAIPGKDMSNAHSAELAYLFDFTLGDKPLTAQQEKLSDQMMRYWGAFAHSGAPKAEGAPAWPRHTEGSDWPVMQLRAAGASKVITSYSADHHCDFWLG
ncbi:carboxylesterase family protein [Streptomyces phaeoluteigriseus]|uniref:Carboxylic ester hydrolase n=1 Tax=Streptomyces phaeoluteigriseus TaxID=114686 RepID=A0ABY4ZCT5_9ACTN|nr:carboxylesterase family protein [Streptomyces phaeoluteigriseus]USQ86827.1 carboxylesterase family protein [Streptomyces phaeoluteigriseus]